MTCAVFFEFQAHSQTYLISPSNEGGFETGNSIPLNGWTIANHTFNYWAVGTLAGQRSGNRGAYITRNGTAFNYRENSSATSHFYRDVVIPNGATNITLNFYWKGQGEIGYDRALIYTAPTNVTPAANTPASSSTALIGANLIWTQPALASTYTLATITLPADLAGSTVRLIFTWQNDASVGGASSFAVDDISLFYTPAPICTGTPSAESIIISSSSGCANSDFTLSAPSITNLTGLSHKWQKSADGINGWTDIGGAIGSQLTTSTSALQYYRLASLFLLVELLITPMLCRIPLKIVSLKLGIILLPLVMALSTIMEVVPVIMLIIQVDIRLFILQFWAIKFK